MRRKVAWFSKHREVPTGLSGRHARVLSFYLPFPAELSAKLAQLRGRRFWWWWWPVLPAHRSHRVSLKLSTNSSQFSVLGAGSLSLCSVVSQSVEELSNDPAQFSQFELGLRPDRKLRKKERQKNTNFWRPKPFSSDCFHQSAKPCETENQGSDPYLTKVSRSTLLN